MPVAANGKRFKISSAVSCTTGSSLAYCVETIGEMFVYFHSSFLEVGNPILEKKPIALS